MPLALTMRENHRLRVGSIVYTVVKVHSGMSYTISGGGREFAINCTSWTEVFEGVKIQAGIPRNVAGKLVRAVIDAPREIDILLIK